MGWKSAFVARGNSESRSPGTQQILNLWEWGKDITNPEALWGDEIEYLIVDLDPSWSRATVLLCQESILQQWDKQTNEKSRRALIKSLLGPSQYPLTIASFPRLGVKGQYSTPHYAPSQSNIHYRMLPPQLLSPALRHVYMAQKILGRRQRPIGVHVPLFQDRDTPRSFLDDPFSSKKPEKEDNCVYLEGQGFGCGCCALQTTFQTETERDARWLHDQLVILGPTMMALTAATPIFKGFLVNTDSRWNCLVASLDDRTQTEVSDFITASKTCCSVPLTRWSSNRVYLSHERPPDIANACRQVRVDESARQQLLEGGMDESIALYFSHIIWYDPLCLSQDDIDSMSPETTHILQKFQHGVWHHVHLKMPDASIGAGWRVEFRPMEVQPKDSENAAFSVFMFLLSRAILTYRLNFYIPIELVTESMQRAQSLDAVTKERFWFRRRGWAPDGLDSIQCHPQNGCAHTLDESTDGAYTLMTMDEIINGERSTSPARFPGLVAIVRSYLLDRELLPNEEAKLIGYLNLISCRASGSLPTPARWMRNFVAEHEDYQHDSVVTEKICYDMLKEVAKMNEAD
ncbi:glutamate-cysteine ligase-domain-containing protein [Aspergillus alliaceus]|uniref:Glutamate--cysteine ligase n=1 Tax=Petromyces alliaceus TaxID=209559 RepID=A0A5N7CP01_PETAA|nr:glutamate-cysteine ligase-domain-containing protein [Aspergillus alliaceus]